jgi:DNA repair photolyase
MPSKRLIPLTEHGGEEPVLQYSPMCGVWTVTTYDACDIRCSYCASYAQGPSKPRASAEEVRDVLERQLPSVPRERPICLGAIIDCYAHAEAEHGITRAALEVLVGDDRDLVIVTKGTLIERDLDLLASHGKVAVNVSLPSLDEAVLQDIEPQADSGAERFATIERLAEAGVDVQLHVQPWIPGLTDVEAMLAAADGRFKVWVAPLNVQNPVIARSRWGQQFTQREINEAYVAEVRRIGPRPKLTWARPLWLGDDLLAASQWGADATDCALAPARTDDPLRRPPLPVRSSDTSDRAEIVARDLATTGEIIDAVLTGQMAIVGMAKLSAFLRIYAGRYPQRRAEAEGPGPMADLAGLLAAMTAPEVRVVSLEADGPVVDARFVFTGELEEPFHDAEPGDRITAEVVATFRYDAYGLLIEQWVEVDLRRIDPTDLVVDDAGVEPVTAAR